LLASYHMEGSAQQWYYRLERDRGVPTWSDFKDYCILFSVLPCVPTTWGSSLVLSTSGTVKEYQEKFLALLCRAGSLTSPQQAHLFTAVLVDHICFDVELWNPQDLH
jgi:hypothetical protein